MKYQANRNYHSNDRVMTPESLSKKLVEHFKPKGKGLEPCKGEGNIYKFLKDADWCEIDQGKDFFNYNKKVDYIFTNPPWSQIRKFLQHSMKIADNVYLLFTVNHLFTKARIRDIRQSGFGIKEIVMFDSPDNFPQTGFQLGMIHIERGYQNENVKFSFLDN
jgi:hypothetical protein